MLARSYRENGKSKKIFFKLDTLSDCEADQLRSVLKYVKNPNTEFKNIKDIMVSSNSDYLDVAVAYEAWKSWNLNSFFDDVDPEKQREVSLPAIACNFSNRCIDTKSKYRMPYWLSRTALPLILKVPNDSINPSRLFRELDAIEYSKDRLAQHLRKFRQKWASHDRIFN